MPAALFCHVDPKRESERLRLRAAHLAFIVAHTELILAGGPTLSDTGAPETMVLLIDVPGIAEAEAFIRNEPYTAHGVFSRVDVKAWARVLPEEHPRALQEALSAELSKGKP